MTARRKSYVSLSLNHLSLKSLQDEVCRHFGLVARAELHVTLGYLGEAEDEPLALLARELSVLTREPLHTLPISGLGGAYWDDRVAPGHIRSLTPDATPEEMGRRSRVLWWAVEPTEALVRSREVLREAIRRVGLSDRFLVAEFFPHVTVGSFSGSGEEDSRIWNVYDVPKLPTLGRALSPTNISPERLHITRADLHPQSVHIIAEYGRAAGAVVWLTGWPACGKSTLARELRRQLASEGHDSIILDSDEVRQSVFPWLGYSDEERGRAYASFIGLAGLLASEGHIVLVAATAPRRAMREEARRLLPRFIEVFIATSREECAKRDPKGLYERGAIDFTYEPPVAPDVTTPGATDEEGIARILERIRQLRRS